MNELAINMVQSVILSARCTVQEFRIRKVKSLKCKEAKSCCTTTLPEELSHCIVA